MQKRIYLSAPHMGENEHKYVQEAFDTNWILPVGPNIDKFEEALSDYSGVSHVAALTTGTAAIHLALILLGVERGDDVLCSTFTFAGSCNPIVYLGANPVFIDSERETWNMDPDLLEEAIKDLIKKDRKPKALVLVHLYGMPAKLNEILAITTKYEIPIIEDAAEGLGSKYFGKPLGSFGLAGVYSFNGNKIITTSGGGALLSNDEEFIKKARFLATQARDPAPHYEHSHIGYNYRLSNISAGIGRGQMEVLDRRVKARRAIFDHYSEGLAVIDEISFPKEPEGFYANRWLTTMLLDAKSSVTPEDIRLELEKHNIESRPVWKPMHQQPVFKDAKSYLSGVSDELFEHGLCLPSGSDNEEKVISKIISIVSALF